LDIEFLCENSEKPLKFTHISAHTQSKNGSAFPRRRATALRLGELRSNAESVPTDFGHMMGTRRLHSLCRYDEHGLEMETNAPRRSLAIQEALRVSGGKSLTLLDALSIFRQFKSRSRGKL
jgi:hypothetical protein